LKAYYTQIVFKNQVVCFKFLLTSSVKNLIFAGFILETGFGLIFLFQQGDLFHSFSAK